MERIPLDRLIENAERGRVSRREMNVIGEILEEMLDMPLLMFINSDDSAKKNKSGFDNMYRILEIFGMSYYPGNNLRFRDIVYQANIYLQSHSSWMREAGYQAAEQLQLIFLSMINLSKGGKNSFVAVWKNEPKRSGITPMRRKRLEKWLELPEETPEMQWARTQFDFLHQLSLQDFMEYCQTADQLPKIYHAAGWDMAENEEDGSMEYQRLLYELICSIGSKFSKKKQKWIPKKLSLEQQKTFACIFFQSFRNLIPEDYVPPYM